MQLPADTSVSVVPLTVQTADVVDAKLTGRPELAEATRAGGAVPSVWLPGEAKVMVCGSSPGAETVKLRVTGVAAAYVALPDWLAVTVQVPSATRVSVPPLTVQTAGVEDAKLTASPDDAVADKAKGGVPSAWLPGDTNVMLCAALATVNVRATGVAGE
ncbi:MAG: hypothetical protein OEU93_01750 [Rubrivivax sp.]|nr:hypothetical protein [Rubrivivax sp.]